MTVTNTTPGVLVIHAPQAEIEKVLRDCKCISNEKPTPLGRPVMNFDKVAAEQQPARTANTKGNDKPVPLGHPRMLF